MNHPEWHGERQFKKKKKKKKSLFASKGVGLSSQQSTNAVVVTGTETEAQEMKQPAHHPVNVVSNRLNIVSKKIQSLDLNPAPNPQ